MNRQLALGIGEQRQPARLARKPRHAPPVRVAVRRPSIIIVDDDPPVLAQAGLPRAHHAVLAAPLEDNRVDAHAAAAELAAQRLRVRDARRDLVGADHDDLDVLAGFGRVAADAGEGFIEDRAPVVAVLADAGLPFHVVACAEELGA